MSFITIKSFKSMPQNLPNCEKCCKEKHIINSLQPIKMIKLLDFLLEEDYYDPNQLIINGFSHPTKHKRRENLEIYKCNSCNEEYIICIDCSKQHKLEIDKNQNILCGCNRDWLKIIIYRVRIKPILLIHIEYVPFYY